MLEIKKNLIFYVEFADFYRTNLASPIGYDFESTGTQIKALCYFFGNPSGSYYMNPKIPRSREPKNPRAPPPLTLAPHA